MNTWKKVYFNKQNIQHETDRAVVIKLPHKSAYDGYVVWVPSKLVRAGRHSYESSFSFTDEFEFRLKKYGQGRYNYKDVLDEKILSPEEFADCFGGAE